MDGRISSFLTRNRAMTLATSAEGLPYCAHCFYAYHAKDRLLIFLSCSDTRHIMEALLNDSVAGTVSTNVNTVARLRGIQFTGTFIEPGEEDEKQFYEAYYARFPFARAHRSEIWAVRLNYIKMTDNTLGFGTKLVWER